jgi:hypothetical protein
MPAGSAATKEVKVNRPAREENARHQSGRGWGCGSAKAGAPQDGVGKTAEIGANRRRHRRIHQADGDEIARDIASISCEISTACFLLLSVDTDQPTEKQIARNQQEEQQDDRSQQASQQGPRAAEREAARLAP